MVLCAVFTLSLSSMLAPSPARAATADQAGFGYMVQWGDSLWKLARRFGTTVDGIRRANGLTGTTIFAGKSLFIPSGSGGASGAGGGAQPVSAGVTDSQVDLLARLIQAEAQGEPYAGQVAVGAVVLNRVRSSLFPNSLEGVIYQPGEFEPVMNGEINRPPSQSAINAAVDAIKGWDPTGGALFFFNPAKVWWNTFLWAKQATATIGAHLFLK